MPVRKLETVDAFVLTDFGDVPASGYARRARKILQSSTWDMARSATYCFASFAVERSGASAGINATDDVAGEAVASFRSELASEAQSGNLQLLAGKGVDETNHSSTDGSLLVATVMASAEWAVASPLEGRTVAIEGAGTTQDLLRQSLEQRGAVVVEVDGVEEKPWMIWGAEADILLIGSKPGTMKHDGAEMVNAKAVVPWGPIPATTKALAVLLKRGVVYVPDFISASGPLLNTDTQQSETSAAKQVIDALSDCGGPSANGDEPLFLAAARRAEAFLQSWQQDLPFGRPLAG